MLCQIQYLITLVYKISYASGTYLMEGSWANNSNLVNKWCCFFQVRSQFCICHDSLAVVTCANLWPDWIIQIMIKIRENFQRFQLWAHKPIVKRVREVHSSYSLSYSSMPCSIPPCHIMKWQGSIIHWWLIRWSHKNGRHFAGDIFKSIFYIKIVILSLYYYIYFVYFASNCAEV